MEKAVSDETCRSTRPDLFRVTSCQVSIRIIARHNAPCTCFLTIRLCFEFSKSQPLTCPCRHGGVREYRDIWTETTHRNSMVVYDPSRSPCTPRGATNCIYTTIEGVVVFHQILNFQLQLELGSGRRTRKRNLQVSVEIALSLNITYETGGYNLINSTRALHRVYHIQCLDTSRTRRWVSRYPSGWMCAPTGVACGHRGHRS